MALINILRKGDVTNEFVDFTLSFDHSVKAIEQYVSVVLFFKRCMVLKTMNEILKRDHSNESY